VGSSFIVSRLNQLSNVRALLYPITHAKPNDSLSFRFLSSFLRTSFTSRSFQLLFVIFIGRVPKYLPFISRIAYRPPNEKRFRPWENKIRP